MDHLGIRMEYYPDDFFYLPSDVIAGNLTPKKTLLCLYPSRLSQNHVRKESRRQGQQRTRFLNR